MGSTKPEHIKLKDSIAGTLGDQRAISDDPGRTPEKDKAAEWLIKNVIETGEWPLSYNELDERSDWSAGHFRNVYTYYFEPADDTPDTGAETAAPSPASVSAGSVDTSNMSIDVPDTVSDMPSFIAGISVGYKLAQDEEQ